jgi:hypothetical protein
MEFSEKSLHNLVKKLSCIIKEKRNSSKPDLLNAEWTNIALIVPLLEELGWDKSADIAYEYRSDSNESRLDLIIKCQTPIGIKTGTLYKLPPQNIEDPRIKNGLSECKAKKAPYFIWTNGDCWQFFCLALASAPFYQVSLREIENGVSLLDKLLIIKKDTFTSHPERFNKAISEHLKMIALPRAWTAILQDHTQELLQIFRKGLQRVDVKDEVILKFLKAFKPEGSLPQARSPISVPKGKHWELLIDSYESPYRLARWFFQTSYYRKLGEYLINEKYKPWSKDSTWRHAGLPDGTNEDKKVLHAVVLFREWGFIEETGVDKYRRVEGCAPYLKKLLETPAS